MERSRRRVPPRDRGLGRSRRDVHSVRRHRVAVFVRSGPSRLRAFVGRRSGRTPAHLRRQDQRNAGRTPGRPHRDAAPMPRQPRRATGPPKAPTIRLPRCCSTRSTSTDTFSNTTPAAPAVSSRCAFCPRARWLRSASFRARRRCSKTSTTWCGASTKPRKYAPLEGLALCPQCGFASSVGGNPVTAADQRAKLARLVEIARRAWGAV